MGQYLLIPFLGGWTSIYQLFWCSPGVQGFDTLPYEFFWRCSKMRGQPKILHGRMINIDEACDGMVILYLPLLINQPMYFSVKACQSHIWLGYSTFVQVPAPAWWCFCFGNISCTFWKQHPNTNMVGSQFPHSSNKVLQGWQWDQWV